MSSCRNGLSVNVSKCITNLKRLLDVSFHVDKEIIVRLNQRYLKSVVVVFVNNVCILLNGDDVWILPAFTTYDLLCIVRE